MKKSLLIPAFICCLALLPGKANAQWSYDVVTFEVPVTKIVIQPGNGNLWQIGRPQKTFFNAAEEGVKAILTDTIHPYPPSDTSSFIYIIRNPYTQTCRTCMDFWHKYDMDSLNDKGLMDASYDGGKSWLPVDDTFNVSPWGSYFMWNGDYHASNGTYTYHKLITTGKSDGWIKSNFCWQWYIPVKNDTIIAMPDSLMIRYTFISGAVAQNREGWMIDDIVTSSAGWELCSGMDENKNSLNISVSPNPFSFQTILQSKTPLKRVTLTVYNPFGQAVKQITNISGLSVTLKRDNLPAGLYFLRLMQDNKMVAAEKLFITD